MGKIKLDGHVHTRSYNNHHLKGINPGVIINYAFGANLDILIIVDINGE